MRHCFLKTLATDVGAVLKLPDTRERMEGQGLEISYAEPAAFGAYLKSELGRWTALVQAPGLNENPR